MIKIIKNSSLSKCHNIIFHANIFFIFFRKDKNIWKISYILSMTKFYHLKLFKFFFFVKFHIFLDLTLRLFLRKNFQKSKYWWKISKFFICHKFQDDLLFKSSHFYMFFKKKRKMKISVKYRKLWVCQNFSTRIVVISW